MQKILEQLYDGEIYPNEQPNIRVKGYKEIKDAAFQAYEAFEDKLCKPMKDELDEFMGKHMEMSCIEDKQSFIDGFKLGARLMIEIMTEEKR